MLKLPNHFLAPVFAFHPVHEVRTDLFILRVDLGTKKNMSRVQERVLGVVGAGLVDVQGVSDRRIGRKPRPAVCERVFM